MKVLRSYPVAKYQTAGYKAVGFDIYHNLERDCFALCLEMAEPAEQYPLEDLLEQYWLVAGDYTGDFVEFDGDNLCLLEVETLNAGKEDLIYLLNFSTIIGKEVVNFPTGKYESFGLKDPKESSFYLNGEELRLPIYYERTDRSGMVNFGNRHGEAVMRSKLTEGQRYDYAEAIGLVPDLIYLRDWTAYLVGKKDGVDMALAIGTGGIERLAAIE